MAITISSFSDVQTPIISGDLITVTSTLLADGSPFLLELWSAINAYEQRLITAAAMAEVPAIDPAEVEELQRQIADRDATIEKLKLDIAPDIAALVPALRSAGLDAWGARATKNQELIVMLFELFAIASEPRSYSQCQRIKDAFGAITKLSSEEPTQDEAIALQAILDVGSKATGPVAAKWLQFV